MKPEDPKPELPKSDIDLIAVQASNVDFPLWRDFIHTHRDYFNKVVVVFMNPNEGDDYREFIKTAMAGDDITFMDSRPLTSGEDWRNVAVNQALDVCPSNWVWFTEQDFFVVSAAFWALIARLMLDRDAIGYKDGATRLHPSCLFVKRYFIDKTHRDFGIVPDRLDHFARFFTSLRLSGANIGLIEPSYNGTEIWYHMNGLSHNLTLLRRGELVTYKPDEFLGYLQLCLQQENLDPRFKAMAEAGVTTLEAQLS
jgi:hypothetical protein